MPGLFDFAKKIIEAIIQKFSAIISIDQWFGRNMRHSASIKYNFKVKKIEIKTSLLAKTKFEVCLFRCLRHHRTCYY